MYCIPQTTIISNIEVTMREWTQTDLIGGHAALDFINTVSDVGKSRDETRLATWKDYLGWLAAAKVEQFEMLNAIKINQSATLAEIHDLRETGYSVFHDLAAGNSPKKDMLAKLQDYIKDAFQHAAAQSSLCQVPRRYPRVSLNCANLRRGRDARTDPRCR
jgi:hypothetical protein